MQVLDHVVPEGVYPASERDGMGPKSVSSGFFLPRHQSISAGRRARADFRNGSSSGHCRSHRRRSKLGGKRAHRRRLGKDQSPSQKSSFDLQARNTLHHPPEKLIWTERDDRPARDEPAARSIIEKSSSFSRRMFSTRTLRGRHRSGLRRLSTGEDCGPPLRTGRFPRADSSLQRASHAR
jgi:hypothetical protein